MLGKIESGEVIRHVGTNGAFAVQEHITLPDGRSFPKTYTVWADSSINVQVGQIVTVTGEVTIKLREYAAPSGMKTAIDVNFNNPNVTLLGQPKPATPEATAEAIQEIANNTIQDTPF